MKHTFAKYLCESGRKGYNDQFSFKYFLNITFVREILPKMSGGFGLDATGMNRLNRLIRSCISTV